MKRIAFISGWAVAGVLAIAAFVLYGKNEGLGERIDEMERGRSGLELRLEQQTEQIQKLAEVKSELALRVDEAEEALARLEESADTLANTSSPPPPDDSTAPPKEEKPKNPFARMFGGAMTDEMAENVAGMTAEMQYGELIVDLKLSPEKASEVRAIIRDVLSEQMKETFRMQRGELESSGDTTTYYKDVLRAELAQALNPEEMEYFEEYQDGMAERMMRRSYDMQLNMYAAGLTEENRAMVLDVLVEEALLGNELLQTQTDTNGGMTQQVGAQFDLQLGILERSAERLTDALDEDQYAILQRFIDQQASTFEMARQMMENQTTEE